MTGIAETGRAAAAPAGSSDGKCRWAVVLAEPWPWWLCLATVLGLLVTIDVPIAGSKLRLYLSDVLAPAALAALLLSGDTQGLVRWLWHSLPIRLLALAGATMAVSVPLGASLGWVEIWSVSRVAALVGCAGYVVLGAAAARRFRPPAIRLMLYALVVANALMAGSFLASRLMFPDATGAFSEQDRYVGLQSNPNAMAVVCFFTAAVALAGLDAGRRRTLALGLVLGAVSLFSVIATGSAATLVAAAPLLVLGLVNRVPGLAKLFLCLAGAAALVALFVISFPSNRFGPSEQMMSKIAPETDAGSDATGHRVYEISVRERLSRYRQALALWRESPILGKGLGAVLRAQIEADPPSDHPTVVHNTYLWILAETGLIGFAAWLAFAVTLAVALRPFALRAGAAPGIVAPVVLFLAAWATMMLFHELLLQRLPWLAIGLALALAAANGSAVTPRSTTGTTR
jgi:O-antigen ligase